MHKAKFSIGQCIRHRLFDYRGVIYDVDPVFAASDEWYEQVARTRPPKDEPWYHVLVDGAGHETYVAERNLDVDPEPAPVSHPRIGEFFSEFSGGIYLRGLRPN